MPGMGNSPSRRSARLAARTQASNEGEAGASQSAQVERPRNTMSDSDEDYRMEDLDEEMEDDDSSEEEEEGEEGEESDDEGLSRTNVTRHFLLAIGSFAHSDRSRQRELARARKRFGAVPDDRPPMQNELSQVLERASSFCDPRHPCCVNEEKEMATTSAGSKTKNVAVMLSQRQFNKCGNMCSWNEPQRRHFTGAHCLPNKPLAVKASMRSRCYIGQYSHQGDFFVAAFQREKRVRIYEVEHNWRIKKDVYARNLRWTVTDTTLSNDQGLLVYASLSPVLNLVNVTRGGVDSQANVTEIHESLHLDVLESDAPGGHETLPSFAVYSVKWSADSHFLCAGAGQGFPHILLFDVQKQKTVLSIEAHEDDVNAVAFMDETSNIIASGSDDDLIKIWDRRSPGRASGVLMGHTQGLTFLDPKGDGRYLLSNSKDQTAKIWDIRKMCPGQQFNPLRAQAGHPNFAWDYRNEEYPARGCNITHSEDSALQTFYGHTVNSTLIRAYWSPMHSTGQRFIYTGSSSGSVFIYDAITAKVRERLGYHTSDHMAEIIRDVSWHPYEPSLISAGFDGSLVEFGPSARPLEEHLEELGPTGHDVNYYW